MRHARVCFVVEPAFRLLKRRWKIVRSSAPVDSLNQQTSTVYAVTGLRNFMIFSGEDLDDEEDIDTLNLDELMFLRQANQREERLMDILGGDSERTRHTVAILMWEADEKAKKEITQVYSR